MNVELQKQPAHESVYQGLRQMILGGDFAPGQAVTIQGLVELLGAGMTPVREAIRRLISEGALQFQGNRRVSVPELSLAQIDELTFARCALEPELARRATRKIKPDQIYALRTIDEALNAAIARGDVKGYLLQNYRFHMALYGAAGSEVVLPLVQALWLRSAPSLRVMCGRFGTQNLPDMHVEALAGLRAGDGEAVAQAIRLDIVQGLENIRAVLEGRGEG
ncbi:GntR family transcriptional regulator [Rhodobacter xanthinilyticus]|uniref:GntR family transcriptional regulator n=1 Tax=Rhodobacter xanthinilyticus TaxID=1850250 RepID=A0A1D9MBI3_9RHOB|nr:GntR family transcriptional regulator [Rhodobacter xanthinilyticus]AOZ69226.1 GntR family transcriptional regulator [Rhodobacter xanthinilyticus]